MPRCGSQIILCDVPIRFDTYKGCGHACSYCFVLRKTDISKIKPDETVQSLKKFIEGKRQPDTNWCDWDIPIHWGGMSDPFQPAEKIHKRSLQALEVFKETQYPFIVSTKSDLIAQEPYLSLVLGCNCVVQFSIASSRYDVFERGASSFSNRIKAAEKIAAKKRVIFRIQPYIPQIFKDVFDNLQLFKAIGVHGIVIEGMKYTKPTVKGLVRVGNDYAYPVSVLLPQFESIKEKCHKLGLKFYCGENRLRALGDSLCCCGVDGLGWRVNTANLNHELFDKQNFFYTEQMKKKGTAGVFKGIEQNQLAAIEIPLMSFADKMEQYKTRPYAYSESGYTFNEAQKQKLRQYMKDCLKKSGKKAVDIDKCLGTNGMAGHYLGRSQWAFPTREAWAKMRLIMPMMMYYDSVLRSVGIQVKKRNYNIYGLE